MPSSEQADRDTPATNAGPAWVKRRMHHIFARDGRAVVVAMDGAPASKIRAWAAEHGGHATLYRGADKSAGVFHPLPSPMVALHRRLKQVFDPQRVLNRGRLFAEL